MIVVVNLPYNKKKSKLHVYSTSDNKRFDDFLRRKNLTFDFLI